MTYWYGERAIHETREVVEAWRARHPRGTILVPAKDLAFATRDLGTAYLSRDELAERRTTLCKQPAPLLIVSRFREDSSLARAPELERLRACLPPLRHGVDIVTVGAYSRD